VKNAACKLAACCKQGLWHTFCTDMSLIYAYGNWRRMKMRKIVMMHKGFVYISFACVLLSIKSVYADDYINKDFPSDEMLSRGIKSNTQWEIVKTLGKYKEREDFYHVYCLVKMPPIVGPGERRQLVSSFTLTKLDTNVWVVSVPDYRPWVLQK
jgi:hypothetical protein